MTSQAVKKLTLFAVALSALFLIGAGAGRVLDPGAPTAEADSQHGSAKVGEGMHGGGHAEMDRSREPITDFDLTHTKRLHLHPEMAADGTWSAPLRLGTPGSYRLLLGSRVAGEVQTVAFTEAVE